MIKVYRMIGRLTKNSKIRRWLANKIIACIEKEVLYKEV